MSAPARSNNLARVLDNWKQIAAQEYNVKNRNKHRTDLDRKDRKQSTASETGETFNRHGAEISPLPDVVDRPGFDLGGSTGNTTAGTGLGLGNNAGETRMDRSLPGRRAKAILSIPRWKSF